MAKSSELTLLQKQNFLHSGKTPQATLISLGEGMLSKKLLYDACQFFIQASHRPGLERIKPLALESGDPFLLSQLSQFDKTLVSEQDWVEAAKNAEAQGKKRYAAWGYEQGGDDANAKRLTREMNPEEVED